MTRFGRYVTLLTTAAILQGVAVEAHDWYTGLVNKKGWICCSKDDFKPVQAWTDDNGQWHALYPNEDGTKTEYAIEEWQMVDDKFNKEPFQAHLAVMNGQVRCFLRKSAGG